MKKFFYQIICLILCAIFITSCSPKKDENNGASNNNQTTTTPTKVTYDEGIHDLTATETTKWLVRNGATNYKILLPNKADNDLVFAKNELVNFFQEATGVKLAVETESSKGKTHDANQRYISLGDTKMLESANIDLRTDGLNADQLRKYNNDGVRIATKDSTIYITGGKLNGVLYGVYDLLQIYFNFDWYSYDCYDLDTGKQNLKLLNFDVLDIPDFENRTNSRAVLTVNNSQERFRANSGVYDYVYIATGSYDGKTDVRTIHNTSELINVATDGYDKYKDYWLAETGFQLCYTAHGNQEAYDAMVHEIARKFEGAIMYTAQRKDKHKNKIDLGLMVEDDKVLCNCEHCTQGQNYYGAYTALIIKLCNAVMAEVKDVWMNSEEGLPYKNEDIRCSFFAYQSVIDPPNVKFDETTGKYALVNEELKMRDDVGVFYCLTKEHNQLVDFYAKDNDEFRKNFDIWGDISSFMHVWGYQTNFYYWIDFHNSFDFYSNELFQYMAAKGVKMAHIQNAQKEDVSAFSDLKNYLQSKYLWDCTQDPVELQNKYFKAMYGEGADTMKEYFEYSKAIHVRNYTEFHYKQKGLQAEYGDLNREIHYIKYNTADYETLGMLKTKMAYCDDALKIVEGLYKESNPEKYELLKKHIEKEWLSPAYNCLALQSATLKQAEGAELATRLYNLYKTLNYVTTDEYAGQDIGSDVTAFYNKWVG